MPAAIAWGSPPVTGTKPVKDTEGRGELEVLAGVFVGTLVGVFVGLLLGVLVGVFVGVSVGVLVGVFVGVFVGVLVGVSVGVLVGVSVGVFVGVLVGVSVGVLVGVLVGVSVGILVGVAVGASFVSVYVHVTVSDGARLIIAVAVPRLTVVLFVGSTQTRFVRVQPAGMFSSVASQVVPGGTLKVSLLGSVPSASSSKEKFWVMVLLLVRTKLKSCGSSGTASLTITIVPLGMAVITPACIWLSREPIEVPSSASNATW